MKNKFLLIFLAFISINIFFISGAEASPIINDIHVNSLGENNARVSWSTNENTTGYIYFGESASNMPFYVGDLNNSRSHEADITGLKRKTGYYYKIVAISENGTRSESFVNYFSTKNIIDTRSAIISNVKKLQATDTAFALSFFTDEKTSVYVKYGTSADNLNKTWRFSGLKQEWQIIITGLKASTRYYYEIYATDEDKNISTYSGDLMTSSYPVTEIKINNLSPEGTGEVPLLAESAIITWETNVLTTADISYGTDPDKLNKNQKVTTIASLNHKATLEKLNPNTTYYYKLKLKSDFNKKTLESQIYSFKTAPLTNSYLSLYFKNGDLVKYKSTTYFIYNNTAIAINNNDKIKSISSASPKTITETYFKAYQTGTPYWGMFSDGQVVKEANKNTIYLIDGNYKRPIASWAVFSYLHYTAKDIVIAKSGQLNAYKNGALIKDSREVTGSFANLNNRLVKSAGDPTVYFVANGKKMPFYNEASFVKRGYSFKNVRTISNTELNSLPDGQLIM